MGSAVVAERSVEECFVFRCCGVDIMPCPTLVHYSLANSLKTSSSKLLNRLCLAMELVLDTGATSYVI